MNMSEVSRGGGGTGGDTDTADGLRTGNELEKPDKGRDNNGVGMN
jgi:hypothetical protein